MDALLKEWCLRCTDLNSGLFPTAAKVLGNDFYNSNQHNELTVSRKLSDGVYVSWKFKTLIQNEPFHIFLVFRYKRQLQVI